MELLEGLNAAQREAVLSTEGFVRVIAGAGSGKTRALTRRFAYLVTELGILPGNLLCVTFTNKAANEMRQRIHNLTGDEDTGYINTFHGFCVSILQEDSHAVGYPKSFLVLDNSDIDAMLQIIYEERGLTLRDMTFSHARDMIEMLKQKERPEYYEDMLTLPLDTLKEKYWKAENAKDSIFYGYLYQEKKCFALDYNDLIVFTLHIFRTHEDIRLKWQKRLEYIMIDEFQDTSTREWENFLPLLQNAMAQSEETSVLIVGDIKQSIYRWRGGDLRAVGGPAHEDHNVARPESLFDQRADALHDGRPLGEGLDRDVTRVFGLAARELGMSAVGVGEGVAQRGGLRGIDGTLLGGLCEGFVQRTVVRLSLIHI